MMYLCVIFVPPVYFMLRKKWGAFALNAILYGLALFLLVFGIGVAFWILAVGHAGWHLRRELMEQHAEMIASKIAARRQGQP